MLAGILDRSGIFRTDRHAPLLAGIPALAIIVTLAALPSQAGAEEAKAPLRLCADPTNLPFSSESPTMPGFYLEIGEALGKALDRPVTYSWYKSYFGKRTVRVTLLGKQCDAMIGLPRVEDFMGPAVIFSKSIITEAYALVSAKGSKIGSIDDLKGKRVAVQYELTPQNLLAQRDEIEKVTVLSPEEGMKVLDQGKADVAFIWGPVAGWLNKTEYNDRFEIQTSDGPGLSWQAAIGFAKSSSELRDQVDAALPGLEATISGLITKYGFPSDAPVKFGMTTPATKQAAAEKIEQPAEPSQPKTIAVATTDKESDNVNSGREVFNGTCAHCHGPDAVQSERRIDLRLLKHRYGDDMRDKFWATVHEGRPSKGMPSWKEVFTDDQLNDVYAYLLTLQTPTNSSN